MTYGMELFCTFVVVYAIVEVFWYWYIHVRHIPLTVFGMANVLFVLGRQPAERRAEILARGWMTQSEYHDILYRLGEDLCAELKRRGLRVDDHGESSFEA